jgi:uncharacterized PurR-regulated membrane protein YhhQ (DUF165 family)
MRSANSVKEELQPKSKDQQENITHLRYSHYFIFVVALLIACLISANIIAVKLVSVFCLVLPAAIIIFPVSYILGDVLTEV